mgnify:FL=1
MDHQGGFVTGGGWIMSPPGACPWCKDSPEAKANFGFVSKYKKGAGIPTGQTQFRFKAGDLNFHAGSYQWLVIAGPEAIFQGEGTINRRGAYKFMVTATDGHLPGGDKVDTFRIRIWVEEGGTQVIVYDNRVDAFRTKGWYEEGDSSFNIDDNQVDLGDDEYGGTELGGGSIVIHREK